MHDLSSEADLLLMLLSFWPAVLSHSPSLLFLQKFFSVGDREVDAVGATSTGNRNGINANDISHSILNFKTTARTDNNHRLFE
mmetsp:Transcript_29277/g.79240  ORF Transcript_29277/g.79240 Transcript_29277/m.79240 type:complete len:83 (-) Transcript_29277:33-281(-)